MSTQSNVKATVVLQGDVAYNQEFEAVANTISPAQISILNLAVGANSVSIPSAGSTQCTTVTIIPPAGNTNSITLKGISGDTGVALNPGNPTMLGVSTTQSTLVLTVSTGIDGVRFIFT